MREDDFGRVAWATYPQPAALDGGWPQPLRHAAGRPAGPAAVAAPAGAVLKCGAAALPAEGLSSVDVASVASMDI